MAISKREGNTKMSKSTDGSNGLGKSSVTNERTLAHRPSKEAWLALWLVYVGPAVLTKGSLIEEESES